MLTAGQKSLRLRFWNLVLMLSFAGACSSQGSEIPPPFTPADDVQFIDGMVPHHQGAVLMANRLIVSGVRSDLKAMAQRMRESQNQEIAMMRAARQALTGSSETPPMSDPHMQEDIQRMMQLSGAELDRAFLEDMIPHHAGAIIMSHRAAPNLQRADMKTLAAQIVESQAREIGEMNQMRTGP